MPKKPGFINPARFREFTNNPEDLFNLTMANRDEKEKSEAFPDPTAGPFRAVCLSGVQDADANATKKDGVMEIIVRPLEDTLISPQNCPDPREFTTADDINRCIAMHRSVFKAISNFDAKDHSAIKFGQLVMCNWHKTNPPGDLRFEEPNGIVLVKEYQDLAAIEGVAAGALFTPPGSWPAGMQTIINSINSVFQTIGDWMSGDSQGGGGGGAGDPGAGKKFDGGNNTNTPKEEGVVRNKAWETGLGWNCKRRKTMPTKIILHCTATGRDFRYTLKSQNMGGLNYNFLIDRDGRFTQAVHPDLSSWHAGGDGNLSVKRFGYRIGNMLPRPDGSIGVSWCNMAADCYKQNPSNGTRYDKKKKKDVPTWDKNPDSVKPLKSSGDGRNVVGFAGYGRAHTFKWEGGSPKVVGKMGVERRNKGKGKWTELYSQEAINAGIDICAVLCLKYGIDPNQIYSHQMLTTKGDPGGTFYPVFQGPDVSADDRKYDPNLVEFKNAVRARMPHFKDKQLLDWRDRIVAGWNAPEEAPPPPDPNAPEETKLPPPPEGPVDNNGKEIPEGEK